MIETPLVTIQYVQPRQGHDFIPVWGYMVAAPKGKFSSGDKAIYLPERSRLPVGMLENMKLWDRKAGKGKLAGREGNIVKATLVEDRVCQGLLYPDYEAHFSPGDLARMSSKRIASHLGVSKWERSEPIGDMLDTRVFLPNYDVRDVQRYELTGGHGAIVGSEDDKYVVTEKLNGTFVCYGYVPYLNNTYLYDGGTIITDRPKMQKNMAFMTANPKRNEDNVVVDYWREHFMKTGLWEKMTRDNFKMAVQMDLRNNPFYILGELVGTRDMKYGRTEPELFVFGLIRGISKHIRKSRYWMASWGEVGGFCAGYGLKQVPLIGLSKGKRGKSLLYWMQGGDMPNVWCKSKIADCMSEGIVLAPFKRTDLLQFNGYYKLQNPDFLVR